MRIENFLADSARRHPDKAAVIADGVALTYAEIDRLSDAFARSLLAQGIGRGDRVVLVLDNGWEFAVATFGALKAGAAFSPVNPSTKPRKLATLLADCQPRALVTQSGRYESMVRQAISLRQEAGDGSLALLVSTGAARGDRSEHPCTMPFSVMVALTPDAAAAVPLPGIATDLAMLVYTSGSTGVPKGVAMAHQNVVAAATLIAGYLEMLESDVVLCALPLSHNYGLYQLMTATKVGATVVLEKSFAFPMAVLERAERFQVTTIPLVPTMVSMLLQMKDLQPGRVPSLRCLTNAAAPLAPAHVARLQELFPAARLYCMYGLTECVRGTYLPPEDVQTRPGSVGHAIPGTEAWLVDENGSRVEAGEVGELVIRGPHVMCGYWNKPSETEKVLRSGAQPWEKLLYTGDLFRADSEGYLYFVSRKDHMIKSRGEKVSPNEVESVLFALPGVREAAVVGMPHPVFGTLLHAIVVLEPGAELTKRQILRHCSERLEDFMVPAEIEFRTELPKSENGKLLRHLLVAQHQEAAE